MKKPVDTAAPQRLVTMIDAALAQPNKPGEEDWQGAKRKARALLETFQNEHGATFNAHYDGYALKIGGIRTSCTSGEAGLLRNWRAAALKRIEQAGEA